MNVYFVFTQYEHSGFYVIAETAGQAKSMCQNELDQDYVDLRANKQKVNPKKLNNLKPCVIDVDDKTLLKKLGLKYYDEDRNEI